VHDGNHTSFPYYGRLSVFGRLNRGMSNPKVRQLLRQEVKSAFFRPFVLLWHNSQTLKLCENYFAIRRPNRTFPFVKTKKPDLKAGFFKLYEAALEAHTTSQLQRNLQTVLRR